MTSFNFTSGRAERNSIAHALNIYHCFGKFEVRHGNYARPSIGLHIVDDFGVLVPVVLNRASLSQTQE